MKKSQDILEKLYIFFFSVNVVSGMLWHTTVPSASLMLYIQEVSIVLLFLLSLVVQRLTIEQIVLGILCITATFISWRVNVADSSFFFMSLLMFAGTASNPRKLLRITAILGSVTLILIFLLSRFGIISNLITWRYGVSRESLGTLYPLNFAAFVLYLAVSVSFVQTRKSVNLWWPIVTLLITYFVNNYTHARTDSVCLVVVAILSLINLDKVPMIKSISKIGLGLVVAFGILSIFISQVIPDRSNLYFYLDGVLSGRIDLQSFLFSNYGLKLLGQNIPQIGLGGETAIVTNYFYLDNSWVRLCFMAGLLFSVSMLYAICKLIFRLIDMELYRQAWLIMIILVSAVTEDTFSYLGTNLLIPIFLCSATSIKNAFQIKSNTEPTVTFSPVEVDELDGSLVSDPMSVGSTTLTSKSTSTSDSALTSKSTSVSVSTSTSESLNSSSSFSSSELVFSSNTASSENEDKDELSSNN